MLNPGSKNRPNVRPIHKRVLKKKKNCKKCALLSKLICTFNSAHSWTDN